MVWENILTHRDRLVGHVRKDFTKTSPAQAAACPVGVEPWVITQRPQAAIRLLIVNVGLLLYDIQTLKFSKIYNVAFKIHTGNNL